MFSEIKNNRFRNGQTIEMTEWILQDWPPQHQRRQLRLPLGGWGQLLGQAGPSHFQAEALHDGPRLVERGRRAKLAQTVPQDSHGGFREGREAAETQPRTAFHWRVPGDDTQSDQAERIHVEAHTAVQRALPAWPLWKVVCSDVKRCSGDETGRKPLHTFYGVIKK